DAFALESQRRAARAIETGLFDAELAAVEVQGAKSVVQVAKDEHPRPDTDAASLAKLAPVFAKDGTVTAGNSSGITDGGAALVAASTGATEEARAKGARPLARLVGSATVGVDPARMGIGPVPAVRKLLSTTGLSIGDFGVVELNEAFAAQALACAKE